MDEQPKLFKKMNNLNLYLDVYKFRNHYLIKVTQKINNEPLVFFATATEKELEEISASLFSLNDIDPLPAEKFIIDMQNRNDSIVLFETYRDLLGRLVERTSNQNNINIFSRMLAEDKFADRYLITVYDGPLNNCFFDAEEVLFLGDSIMTVIKNIKDKVYYKFVSIKTDVERMQINDRDEVRMPIAAGLLLPQEKRNTALNPELMRKIMEYGGKKKRKSKRRKSLKKKQRKSKKKSKRKTKRKTQK